MVAQKWMIYGAYGYTGRLVAEEAVRRGHRPVLAGRSKSKLIELAEHLGLDWVAVDLHAENELNKAVGKVGLVFHAAGPFIHTSSPMLQACLNRGTHYLDITGEIPVFQQTFSYDQAARRQGVALISGVGFDVIPTDCLANYVASQVPQAIQLDIAFASPGKASAGTFKSALGMLPGGGLVRRAGELVPWPLGKGIKRLRFSDKVRTALPIPWGDLETAYRATRIPNITTYMAFPRRLSEVVRVVSPVGQGLLTLGMLRRIAGRWADNFVQGPDVQLRKTGRSHLWACAADRAGYQVEAWVETLEAYQFTAVAGVRCVEKLFENSLQGALTPAQAFGADFVLEIEGSGQKTIRLDMLT